MAKTPAAASPVSGNLLFYTTPEPLSQEVHGNLGVQRMEKPFGFAREAHVVPLTVAEFTFAAISFPIPS